MNKGLMYSGSHPFNFQSKLSLPFSIRLFLSPTSNEKALIDRGNQRSICRSNPQTVLINSTFSFLLLQYVVFCHSNAFIFFFFSMALPNHFNFFANRPLCLHLLSLELSWFQLFSVFFYSNTLSSATPMLLSSSSLSKALPSHFNFFANRSLCLHLLSQSLPARPPQRCQTYPSCLLLLNSGQLV
jgi:hypothetical protein